MPTGFQISYKTFYNNGSVVTDVSGGGGTDGDSESEDGDSESEDGDSESEDGDSESEGGTGDSESEPESGDNSFSDCGGNFSDASGVLTSPNYPGNYPDDADCTFLISGPDGSVISFTITNMDIEDDDECSFDVLKIGDGDSSGSNLIDEYCGSSTHGPIVSTGNSIWIRYFLI